MQADSLTSPVLGALRGPVIEVGARYIERPTRDVTRLRPKKSASSPQQGQRRLSCSEPGGGAFHLAVADTCRRSNIGIALKGSWSTLSRHLVDISRRLGRLRRKFARNRLQISRSRSEFGRIRARCGRPTAVVEFMLLAWLGFLFCCKGAEQCSLRNENAIHNQAENHLRGFKSLAYHPKCGVVTRCVRCIVFCNAASRACPGQPTSCQDIHARACTLHVSCVGSSHE